MHHTTWSHQHCERDNALATKTENEVSWEQKEKIVTY